MKVTTKGQVTIPLEIRERLHIYPGAEVEFRIDGEELKLIPKQRAASPKVRLSERMRGLATVKMTTDEILALTRGED